MNKVLLLGRITKEIELKQTQGGKSVIRFSIAVKRDYKNASGEYDSDFPSIVAYGTTAETINKYFHKGDRIGIIGKLMTGNYEKNGAKVYTTDVVAEGFEFIDAKDKEKGLKEVTLNVTAEMTEISGDDELPF